MKNLSTLLLLITLSLLPYNLMAQQKCWEKNDLFYEGYNGKVKSVKKRSGDCADWNFSKCKLYYESLELYHEDGEFDESTSYAVENGILRLSAKIAGHFWKPGVKTGTLYFASIKSSVKIYDTTRWLGNTKEQRIRYVYDNIDDQVFTIANYDSNCALFFMKEIYTSFEEADFGKKRSRDFNINNLPSSEVEARKRFGNRYKFFGDPKVKVLTTDAQGNPLKMLDADGKQQLYEYEYYP